MSRIILDLSGVAWAQIARALKSVAEHVESRATSARVFVDRHVIHEARKLARNMDLEDYIDVEENRRSKNRAGASSGPTAGRDVPPAGPSR
ncbi:hypothetical protein [Sphingobium aquiterrae]|uniref:hypothetical protein n=1 Tax=Sphingobium aquiterrae TaxID=2038656 RepID=UPI0030191677